MPRNRSSLQDYIRRRRLTLAALELQNSSEPFRILHVSVGEGAALRNADYDYYLSVASSESCPDKFSQLSVPAMTWVMIDGKVPWEPEKWKQIYGEWFPSSWYERKLKSSSGFLSESINFILSFSHTNVMSIPGGQNEVFVS